MNTKLPILLRWLPFALIATCLSGLVYVAVQQVFRQSANDPQIEIAEESAAVLATGQPPQMFGTNSSIDISKSLSPFVIAYNEEGKAISGTGSLNGSLPVPPIGVLIASKKNGENRLTWQPQPGVRIAAIIVHYGGDKPGYVLVGKSLREIEKRESTLMLYVFISWITALISTFIVVAFESTRVTAEFSTE